MTEPKKFLAVPLGGGRIYQWTSEIGWGRTSMEFIDGELARGWLRANTDLINDGRVMTITLKLPSGPMELQATIGVQTCT
tara:strand:- start:283 stop:522 length:240 start_codon:yes stop_codon:yes gene_type:complete